MRNSSLRYLLVFPGIFQEHKTTSSLPQFRRAAFWQGQEPEPGLGSTTPAPDLGRAPPPRPGLAAGDRTTPPRRWTLRSPRAPSAEIRRCRNPREISSCRKLLAPGRRSPALLRQAPPAARRARLGCHEQPRACS